VIAKAIVREYSTVALAFQERKTSTTVKKRVRLLPLPPRSLADRRILLIDDSPTIRNVYTIWLQRELGVSVTACGSNLSVELRQILADQEQYDLVFVDLMLPYISGLKVVKLLKKLPHFQHVPIIAISRRSGRWDRLMASLAGAAEYAVKPIALEQLVALARKYLDTDQDIWLR